MDAQTNPPPLGEARSTETRAKKKGPPGALLFVPAALNRGAFLVWLKRIHAWTGFWGALAFLIIGASGMLLNHRATLKIDTGAPREVMSADIAVDPTLIKSPEDLGKWAQGQFGLSIEPRAPRAEGGGGGGGAPRSEGQRGGERGGGLVAMALTGALLWSRMHGPRLAAVGIVTASLLLGLFAALPNLV
jgi:hypothetical protein